MDLLGCYRLAAMCILAAVMPSIASTDLQKVDVVIVGAGYGGLTAARVLTKRGFKVAVLEAMPQVGGRAGPDYRPPKGSPLSSDFYVEQGVAFIGDDKESPDAHRLIVEDLGLEIYSAPVWGPGNCRKMPGFRGCRTGLICRDSKGEMNNFTNLFPGILTRKCVGDVWAIAGLLEITAELMAMAVQIDPQAPWEHPKAREWDSQTFGAWLRERLNEPGYRYMKLTVEPDTNCDLDAMSLLHALFLSKTACINKARDCTGIFDGLYAFNNGFRIKGGGTAPVDRMAAELPKGSLYLSTPVRRLRQNDQGVLAMTDAGSFSASYAIVTGTPQVTSRIEYEPPLHPMRQQLAQVSPAGNAVRLTAVYPSPFWSQEQGLSGSFATLDTDPAQAVYALGYDFSNPDFPYGAIQVQVQGKEADSLMQMSPDDLRANFSKVLASYFGPKALQPLALAGHNFAADPFLGGGANIHFPPGALTEFGPWLRKPHGRIHWAGTEYTSSGLGFGYIQGAISSGNETAVLLSELLRRQKENLLV